VKIDGSDVSRKKLQSYPYSNDEFYLLELSYPSRMRIFILHTQLSDANWIFVKLRCRILILDANP
jgi:hypothetical protein